MILDVSVMLTTRHTLYLLLKLIQNALKTAGNPKAKGAGNSLVNVSRKAASIFLELANLTTTDIQSKLERTKVETMVTIQVYS